MKKNIHTTISGSLPKPSWLAETGKLWGQWKLSSTELDQAKADAMKIVVSDQINAGISIITDGEQTRQHFVTTFIENLSGVDFKRKKTVRIRDRYDAAVPMVVDKINRKKSVFVKDVRLLRSLTSKPIKFTLPGPMTMIDTLYDDYYKSREKLAWRFAEVLNEEVKELVKAGVDIIQFDEPAFNVFFDEVHDWGVQTLERAIKNVRCTTAVHICYGYGIEANIKWKNSLGKEWRQYEKVFPLLSKSKIDQVSLECINSRVPMELISLLQKKDIMVGAIDVATNKIETPRQVANILKQALKYTSIKHLIGCTNCGMVTMPREIANAKLKALADGAALLSREL
jgi:5-methyltetrahydropteroyltriglutamate--homocysteine methyltransferase